VRAAYVSSWEARVQHAFLLSRYLGEGRVGLDSCGKREFLQRGEKAIRQLLEMNCKRGLGGGRKLGVHLEEREAARQ
jgi:hypothetical protein